MEENNKIIAEFMGLETAGPGFPTGIFRNEEYIHFEDLKFHSDWDWLMEVIEKILNICSENDDLEKYHIITDNIPYIQPTYNECVKFIKFYNQLQIK